MTEQNKRLLYLILTLPGLIVPFVPFANDMRPDQMMGGENVGGFMWELLRSLLFDPIQTAPTVWILAAFIPYILVLISIWRWLGWQIGLLGSRLVVALAAVLDVSLLSYVLLISPLGFDGDFFIGANWPVTAAGLALVAASVLLLIFGRTRRVDAVTAAEIGVMGVFMAAVGYGVAFWLAFSWASIDDLDSGALVGLYLCLVFLVRIIDALRHQEQPSFRSQMGGDTVADLETRIEKLERESRMLKWSGLTALVLVWAVTALVQPSDRKVHDQILTRELTIYGPDGRVQAFFLGGRDGPMLKLFNGGTNSSDGLVIFADTDGSGLWIEDSQGRETRLGVSEFRESRKGNARLRTSASILMLDNDKKVIWQAPQ